MGERPSPELEDSDDDSFIDNGEENAEGEASSEKEASPEKEPPSSPVWIRRWK